MRSAGPRRGPRPVADPAAALAFWPLISRLGEAQLLLPAMLLAALWLARQPGGRRPAAAWLLATGLAALVTTASKLAFIGYAIGWAPLDFTGISGHAMFAAAVLPPLLRLAGGPATPLGRQALLAAGYGLATAVGLSRLVLQLHSASEVASGLALGAAASAAALWVGHFPPLRLVRWLPALLLAWALLGVIGAPPSRSHDLVTQLALTISGRDQPYKRWQLHRDHRLRQAAPAGAGSLQPR